MDLREGGGRAWESAAAKLVVGLKVRDETGLADDRFVMRRAWLPFIGAATPENDSETPRKILSLEKVHPGVNVISSRCSLFVPKTKSLRSPRIE